MGNYWSSTHYSNPDNVPEHYVVAELDDPTDPLDMSKVTVFEFEPRSIAFRAIDIYHVWTSALQNTRRTKVGMIGAYDCVELAKYFAKSNGTVKIVNVMLNSEPVRITMLTIPSVNPVWSGDRVSV